MAQEMKDALVNAIAIQQEGVPPIQQFPSDSEDGDEIGKNNNNSSDSEELNETENVFKLLINKKTRLKTIFNPLVLLVATMFVPIILISTFVFAYDVDKDNGPGAEWKWDTGGWFTIPMMIILFFDITFLIIAINYHSEKCCCRKCLGWDVKREGEDKADINRYQNPKNMDKEEVEELSVSEEEEGGGYDDREDSNEDNEDGDAAEIDVEIDISMEDNRM